VISICRARSPWERRITYQDQLDEVLAADLGLDYVQYKLLYMDGEQSLSDHRLYGSIAQSIMEQIAAAQALQDDDFQVIFPTERSERAVKRYRRCWVQDRSFEEIWLGDQRTKVGATLTPAYCPRCWWDKINEALDALSQPIDDVEFI
jgi:hypothetical protein